MIRELHFKTKFRRDVRRMSRRGKDMSKLSEVLEMLARGEKLPARLRDHAMVGNFRGSRECHIEPDWLLLYEVIENENGARVNLERTGTHSDILGI